MPDKSLLFDCIRNFQDCPYLAGPNSAVCLETELPSQKNKMSYMIKKNLILEPHVSYLVGDRLR